MIEMMVEAKYMAERQSLVFQTETLKVAVKCTSSDTWSHVMIW